MYRLVEVGVMLMIFGSLEQNLYSAIKPSDETLEQGRNRDNGELFKLTMKYTLHSEYLRVCTKVKTQR